MSAYDFSDTTGRTTTERGSLIGSSLLRHLRRVGRGSGGRPRSGGGGRGDLSVARQGRRREDDPVVAENVVGAQLAGERALHPGEVPERLARRGFVTPEHRQHRPRQPQRLQRPARRLGAGLLPGPPVDDRDPAAQSAVRECRAKRQLDHLAGRLLPVAARLGTEGDATSGEVGSSLGALPCPAGPLLLERFLAPTGNLGTGLGAVSARSGGCQLRGDHLVHDRHVGLNSEDGFVEIDRPGDLTRHGTDLDGDRHHLPPFTASRMSTTPPLGPGTAPLRSSRFRSGSALTTSRLSVVTLAEPCWPAMRVPLKTLAGVAQAPIDPGARWCLWLPWLAPWPPKLCRFIPPAKPLPLLTAVTSTLSPAFSMSTVSSSPTLYSPVSARRSSTSRLPGSTSATR